MPDAAPTTFVKVAIPVRGDGQVSGHAGQAQEWLMYVCDASGVLPVPQRVQLDKAQRFHHFQDDGPHPLDGVELIVAASAGDGFVRHMAKRGAQVVLTGETDPAAAMEKLLAGAELADTRFDPTRVICKLRDLFSRH